MTTWWDVYETLLHLLLDQTNVASEKSQYLIDKFTKRIVHNQPHGQSLFLPIPKRNCFLANIPDYLCSCSVSVDIDVTDEIIQKGTSFLIDYINNFLLKKFKNLCMRLNLKRIIDAQLVKENVNKYSVIFETNPNGAKFDGQFRVEHYNKSHSLKFQLIGKIIRINSYGLSSSCINNYFLRNFCYCFSYHSKKLKSNLRNTSFIF